MPWWQVMILFGVVVGGTIALMHLIAWGIDRGWFDDWFS